MQSPKRGVEIPFFPLSLSLVFHLDRHSSRSILGKPGDFSPPSCENAKPPPVSRGFFLPSFLPLERERGREPPCFVDGISYLSGCCVFGLETDATTSQTLVGFPARVEDWMKRSWREGKGKRRDVCPSSRDFLPSGFVRSIDPRRERHANRLFPSHFPISPNFFFISSRFLRRVKKTSSEIDDPSRFS